MLLKGVVALQMPPTPHDAKRLCRIAQGFSLGQPLEAICTIAIESTDGDTTLRQRLRQLGQKFLTRRSANV